MQDAIVAREMFPLKVFGIDGNRFHVVTPILDKGEKGAFSFIYTFFPLIFFENLLKFMSVLLALVFSLDKLVEVIFPVEEQFIGVLFLTSSEQEFAIAPVIQVELSSAPLLNLRIVQTRDCHKDVFAELRDSEICQCAEQLCKLFLTLMALEVQRKQC